MLNLHAAHHEGGAVGVILPGAGDCFKNTALELIKDCLLTSVDFE